MGAIICRGAAGEDARYLSLLYVGQVGRDMLASVSTSPTA